MASKKKTICAGCRHEITVRQYLTCSICNNTYDLPCANVPDKRFYNTMTADRKKEWKCQECLCKQPKGNNTNTPIRSVNPDMQDDSSDDEQTNEDSFLGETLFSPARAEGKMSGITLEQISQLLDKKMKANEIKIQSLIKIELRALIKEEIRNTITNEIKNCLNKITTEQDRQKNEIQTLTEKINRIEIDYNKLKKELSEQHVKKMENITTPTINPSSENRKKFVLFGLEENKWETEHDLYDRVINIIYEITNVDLHGYIEEITRLGKQGHRRPLVIELLTKQMTKYILQHSRLFSMSGIAIAEFLDNEAIKKRNELRKILKEARQEGKHAVFRNNRLIINGIEYTEKEETKENTNESKSYNYKQLNKNKHSFRN